MRNRIILLGVLFAAVALSAGCDTLPTIDVAGWFGDSAHTAPQAQPAQTPVVAEPSPVAPADAPPQAAPTQKVQSDPLPAQTDTAQIDPAQNLPVDGMQREDLRGAFGVDDKTEPAGGL
jgi:hypothetical protein